MPAFSRRSKTRLESCHKDIQKVFGGLVKIHDFSVLCGHRSKRMQNDAFNKRRSQLRYPDSKHNALPSLAIDVAPYPIDWEDRGRFYFLAGAVLMRAAVLDIRLRWGGDWNGNHRFDDQGFDDLPHFELI